MNARKINLQCPNQITFSAQTKFLLHELKQFTSNLSYGNEDDLDLDLGRDWLLMSAAPEIWLHAAIASPNKTYFWTLDPPHQLLYPFQQT